MIKEFRDFIMRGNVVDMAVGIIIGVAFGSIIKSLVEDILMPPVGLLLGQVDFSNLFLQLQEGTAAGPYASLAAAKAVGAVTVNYGLFLNALVSFVIVGFAVFMLIRALNRLQPTDQPVAPTSQDCPHCITAIPLAATRCPHCTSQLS
jgi:large conductance mechanosensitive channel